MYSINKHWSRYDYTLCFCSCHDSKCTARLGTVQVFTKTAFSRWSKHVKASALNSVYTLTISENLPAGQRSVLAFKDWDTATHPRGRFNKHSIVSKLFPTWSSEPPSTISLRCYRTKSCRLRAWRRSPFWASKSLVAYKQLSRPRYVWKITRERCSLCNLLKCKFRIMCEVGCLLFSCPIHRKRVS